MPVEQAYAFVPDLASIVRGGSAWCFDASGALVERGANTLRHDFDPATLGYRGVLVEQAATNTLTNPRAEGGVAGAPGTAPTQWGNYGAPAGVSRQIVGIGTEDGLHYVDVRYFGTATATGNCALQPLAGAQVPAAAVGETWAFVSACRLIAGSLPRQPTLSVSDTAASGGFLAASTTSLAFTPTGAALRTQIRAVTRTLANASTLTASPGQQFSVQSGEVLDVTLRWAPLLFVKSSLVFSPSYPPAGTPGPSIRAADVLTMTDIGRWFSGAAGTFVIDFTPGQAASPQVRGLLTVDGGGAGDRLEIRMLNTDTRVRLTVSSGGATVVAVLDTAAASVLARNTLRFSYGPAGYFMSLNGAAPVSAAGALPVNLTHLRLGQRHAAALGQELNGWLGPRLSWYPTQYTDTAADDGFTIRTR